MIVVTARVYDYEHNYRMVELLFNGVSLTQGALAFESMAAGYELASNCKMGWDKIAQTTTGPDVPKFKMPEQIQELMRYMNEARAKREAEVKRAADRS